MDKIAVSVGESCNFACSHCLVPPEKRIPRLSPKELAMLPGEINSGGFKTLLFVGGEPTLYLKDINAILSRVTGLKTKKIKITTNGSFAGTIAAAKKVLFSFVKIDAVQLSYDFFHQQFLPLPYISNLYQACREGGKDFSVVFFSPISSGYAAGKKHQGNRRI